MAIFAIVFAQERFQADGAYYLFKIVNSGQFQIEHQRFILAVSQVLPLIGVKLGWSLNTIIVLNSLNNVVVFYLVFLYATKYLRDNTAGVAIILFMVFGVLYIQFIPMYEIWYGTILLVLVRSHMVNGRNFLMCDLILLGIIMITILFSHPLLFIPLLFLLLFDAAERWVIQWRMFFLVAAIFIFWYIIKKMFLSSYEAGKISLLDFSWNKAYLNLTHLGYYWKLFKFFFSFYTIPMFVYLFTMGFYIVRKNHRKLVLVSAFLFGQILLINLTNEMDWELTPYFERMYMPIIPIVFLPFLYDLFTQMTLKNNYGAILLVLIVGWRIMIFTKLGFQFKKNTAQTEVAITEAQKLSGSKFELDPNDYNSCMKYVDWSFTMETLLRSAAIDKNKTVSICTWEDFAEHDNKNRLNENDYMMRRWEVMPDYSINQNYFHIQQGKYVRLNPLCGK
ncbi:MAG: hypothetical protein NT084_03140 [Bacteroidetes bacterium]|nr:hypothetical protein [Bacteroidota bacterium]